MRHRSCGRFYRLGRAQSRAVSNQRFYACAPALAADSLPLVGLQAAANKGLPQVVVHQQTGLLVDKEDANGLAHAISFLIEDPDAADQMGKSARRRVETMFSWERHVNAYDALYSQLIKHGKATC